jgi:hypothetical protein
MNLLADTDALAGGPDAGITRQEIRAREEDFIGRFLRRYEESPGLPHPGSGKLLAFPSGRPVDRWDHHRRAKDLMVKLEIFDRSLLKEIPLNPGVRIEAGSSGLFSRFTPEVTAVGLALSPMEAFVSSESSFETVSFAALTECIKDVLNPKREFHFLGVFAPTGFTAECRANVPRGRKFGCILLEKGDRTQWMTFGDHEARDLFDLETPAEKLNRCIETIRDHPKLRMKGGHIRIDPTREELSFTDALFEQALAALTSQSQEYVLRQFDGVRILQRSRF